MSNSTLISIIIPVYNTEKYLAKCLDSLLCQTYTNIEIICINDGSTDNSKNILENYSQKDARIKLVHNQNSGPATSRNIGLDNANGEYIMFCDSDDSYKPQMCEKMYKAITENDVDFATCQSEAQYEEGAKRAFSAKEQTKRMPTGLQEVENVRIKKLSVLVWHMIYKKSIIEKYNIRFPDGLINEDVLFNYQYFSVSKKYYGILEELHNYLVRNNSIMDNYYKRTKNSKLFDRIKLFTNFYIFLKNNNLLKQKEEFFFSLLLHQYNATNAILICPEEKKALRLEMLNIIESIDIYTNSLFDLLKENSIEEVEIKFKNKSYIEKIYGKITIKHRLKLYKKLFSQYKTFYWF